jgi:hypothetical protein
MKPTHSGRLERWLGAEVTQQLSDTVKDWYGPPIAIAGVPGHVYACKGGDFCGPIKGGYFANLADFATQRYNRIIREYTRRNRYTLHGFSSLGDLISEATTGGKSQNLMFSKVATTATTVGNSFCMRNVGNYPAARGVGAASGTGVACTSTQGGMPFTNAAGGDTLHVTNITAQATAVSSLLLFDCLWDMTYNHASSTSTSIDANNRPSRYQTAALAPGNFFSSEITTQPVTAHNMTVTYVDQDGNTAEAATAFADSLGVAGRSDVPAGQWFMPINSPDTGLRYVTIIAQNTTSSVTGASTWFIGHPLALVPIPIANVPFIYDGINSAFNLERVYDGACLSLMTPQIATTGGITYNGFIRLVSG